MLFRKAFELMKQGMKVKLPSWAGYWYWSKEKQTIIMHTKDGIDMDIRETQIPDYTFSNIASDEWTLADSKNCEHDAIGNMAIAFVGTSGVQMGWLASQADMLADDWVFAD